MKKRFISVGWHLWANWIFPFLATKQLLYLFWHSVFPWASCVSAIFMITSSYWAALWSLLLTWLVLTDFLQNGLHGVCQLNLQWRQEYNIIFISPSPGSSLFVNVTCWQCGILKSWEWAWGHYSVTMYSSRSSPDNSCCMRSWPFTYIVIHVTCRVTAHILW